MGVRFSALFGLLYPGNEGTTNLQNTNKYPSQKAGSYPKITEFSKQNLPNKCTKHINVLYLALQCKQK